MIEMKNICFSYGDREILKDFNLKINDGQCVCLKGPSGCGKTTVLRLLLGLEKPQSGEISGVENPSVVFQEDRLIDGLSLKKNTVLPLEKTQYKKAVSLLSEANLSDALSKRVSALSGGMKRRAAIVRAVSFGGDWLILDEPFNGLDAENREVMAAMIRREYLEKNKPVLLISHIPADAEALNAEIVEMQ